MNFRVALLCATVALTASTLAWSQEGAAPAGAETGTQAERPTPLNKGFYVAPMAAYVMPYDNRGIDDGLGGTVGFGYRFGVLALEAAAEYAKLDAKSGGDTAEFTAGHVGLLWFPFDSIKGLYGAAAIGRVRTEDQPVGNMSFEGDSLEAGAGYIFPLSFGRYEFGIRSEARVRFSERGRPIALGDDNLPRRFQDVLINLGLQLPFGLKPLAPPPEPVKIAAAPAVCADGIDNDNDGKIDYPNDPGCSGADDADETDAPQCSDGIDNDGDGKIDFPADTDCASAEGKTEEAPCKSPAEGEQVSLKGCAVGDVIVLRGVNFEFDRSRLTANAKTILDRVASELLVHGGIKVEIAGHTDSLGSDDYNQRLSEQRAAAVVAYLIGKGVAKDRLHSVGYGESQPVADNESEEGRELNRRVELKIVSDTPAQTGADPANGISAP